MCHRICFSSISASMMVPNSCKEIMKQEIMILSLTFVSDRLWKPSTEFGEMRFLLLFFFMFFSSFFWFLGLVEDRWTVNDTSSSKNIRREIKKKRRSIETVIIVLRAKYRLSEIIGTVWNTNSSRSPILIATGLLFSLDSFHVRYCLIFYRIMNCRI